MPLQSDQEKARAKGCTIILAVVVFFLLYRGCASLFGDDKPAAKASEAPEKPNKVTALYNSRSFVEKRLKSPSTAVFGYDTSSVLQYDDTSYYVVSYVDSKNAFGAELRSDYGCGIIFHHDGTVECIALKIEPR